MRNFLKGVGSIFNLFPQTDYMAMVPDEGEMMSQSPRALAHSMSDAYQKAKSHYGISDTESQGSIKDERSNSAGQTTPRQ